MNHFNQAVFQVPPSAENDQQPRQLSIKSFTDVDLGLCDFVDVQVKPKPRRRLQDTKTDRADGLDVLIQKTKAIGLRAGEEGLAPNEDGNKWLEAISCRGEKLLWGVKKIRKYVCGDGSDVHAEELLKFNVLERLMYFMDETVDSDVLFEILWIITNIAAGPTAHTTYLVESGFLPLLGNLLHHSLGSIRTQAAWAIGNIIGDREGFRDIVLEAGLLPSILNIWKGEDMDLDSQRESFRISLWIVDNMCRYKPNWQLMQPAFEIIPTVLQQDDPSILKECCWALARILHQSGRNNAIDCMITPVICTRLVEILRWNRSLTTHPILRALINLSSSKNPAHLRQIVHAGIISELQEYLGLPKNNSSFEIFGVQILGNLALHSEYAEKIAGHYSLCQWITKTVSGTKDPELRNELIIAIRNMTFHKNENVTGILAQIGLVRVLSNLLLRATNVSKIQLLLLETISQIIATNRPSVKTDTQYQIMSSNSAVFDYPHAVKAKNFYNYFFSIYTYSAGDSLDEMEHDFFEVDFEEGSDSDEDDIPNVVPFDFSNTRNRKHPHFYTHHAAGTSNSIKDKIAATSLLVIKKVYRSEFESAIRQSQLDSSICNALNGMNVGENVGSKIADLAEVFGKLNYTMSK